MNLEPDIDPHAEYVPNGEEVLANCSPVVVVLRKRQFAVCFSKTLGLCLVKRALFSE